MTIHFTIPGRLIGANDYILKCRTNRVAAASLKAKQEKIVKAAVTHGLRAPLKPFKRPVVIHYLWVEPNKKRDKDNIAFAHKFIQDALVSVGMLKGDGWAYVEGFTDSFSVDKKNPRIEITIQEVEQLDEN